MAFRRRVAALDVMRGEQLTAAMVGIGMKFAGQATPDANIEDTVISASVEALERDDLRVLAVLVTWLGVHHPWLNADRLLRALRTRESSRVGAFWAAIGQWLGKDRRLARLMTLYTGPRIDLLPVGADFQIGRAGEDGRFGGGPLRVPAKGLRDRRVDVLSPAELAERHRAYRYRVLMGPSYRADMWAALEADPSLSAAELARRTYGSFATAWQVKRDREMLAA